jgi:hypothetical protein
VPLGSRPSLELWVDMARKTWVLDTETKGTGANVVPLEKVVKQAEPEPVRRRPTPAPDPKRTERRERKHAAPRPVERSATPLPAGHVRKRTTGEIGKVLAVDAQAGTTTVRWLKGGATSTVPLSSVSRR